MKDMGIVRGSPEMARPLVVGTDTVFVHTDIEPVTEDQNGNPVENEFQYHEIQYDKDEYIQLMAEQTTQNNSLMGIILGGDRMNRRELMAQQMNRAFQLMADGLNLTESQAMEIADLYEGWAAGKVYTTGRILKYGMNADGETQLYTVLQDHTSQEDWTPDAAPSLYKKVGFTGSGMPIWTQPLGASDAYNAGDKVSHNGQEWVSIVDGNVWEPGVYGWEAL